MLGIPACIRRPLSSVRIASLADRGLTLGESVGQRAVRALAVGDVLTADRLTPRFLAQRGQLLTVQLVRDGIEIRSLVRALGDAAYGQTIKARNEMTGEVVDVTMTSPQAGMLAQLAE